MAHLTINKWGNSSGIRLSKNILNALGVEVGEQLLVTIDGNKIVLEKPKLKNQPELTFEELFKDYDGESFQSELVTFEPLGNEKW